MNISRSIKTPWLLRILRCTGFVVFILGFTTTLILHGGAGEAGAAPAVPDNAFPACVQFSPVPAGKGWKDEKPPLSAEVRQDTLVNLVDHGFSVLYYPVGGLSETENQEVLASAQALGMKVNYMTGGFEMFDREHPPAISV